MNNEKDTYEMIEKYLDNTLSGTEKFEFEQKLKENPSLGKEVETHKTVHDLIIDQGLLDLKQKIKTGNFENTKGNNWKIYSLIGTAILIGISIFWFSIQKSADSPNPISSLPVEENKVSQSIVSGTSSLKNTALIDLTKTEKEKTISTTPKSKEVKKQNTINDPIQADSVSPIVKFIKAADIKSSIENYQKIEVPAVKETKPDQAKSNTKVVTIEKLPESKTRQQTEEKNEFISNPSLGQLWEFPIQPGDNCELKIMSRNGDVIFRTNISNGYPNTWNGMSSNGSEVAMGTYLYFISYPDGKMEKGFITIVK